MKSFIVYDVNGVILRTGICSEKSFEYQASSPDFVIEGKANDITQKIVNGAVVDKDVNEHELPEEVIVELKRLRSLRLADSDWTQFPDSPLSDSKKTEWATYRQSLRDIPETYSEVTSLDDIIWPIQPE